MENYVKGKNIEQDGTLPNDILATIPSDILLSTTPDSRNLPIYEILKSKMCWMQMRGGSKLRNFINPCLKSIITNGFVIISGSGPAVGKVASCTEIVKRKSSLSEPKMYQMTKISYHSVIECWDPKTNDLDPIKVTREIPQIDILLGKLEYVESGSDCIEINKKCDNLNIFLDIPPMKNTSHKRKQHKSKSGKKTGTPVSGKLDAARELGMIDKGFSLNGANKRMSLDRSSQYKNRPRDSGQDSSNFANTKDSNR